MQKFSGTDNKFRIHCTDVIIVDFSFNLLLLALAQQLVDSRLNMIQVDAELSGQFGKRDASTSRQTFVGTFGDQMPSGDIFLREEK